MRGELWASVVDYGSDQPLRLETYPRYSRTQPPGEWDFDFTEALAQLQRAAKRLRG